MKIFTVTRLCRTLLLTAAVVVLLSGCGGDDSPGNNNPGGNNNNGGGSDPYASVTLGGKKWMKKNLNVETEGSWCYGEGGRVADITIGEFKTLNSSEIQANCNTYGRLYTWSAAKTACQSVGGSWRLPTNAEWDALVEAAGGAVAGNALKSRSGWYNDGNGTDTYGFSALPGGLRITDGTFINVGGFGYWWTATEYDSGYAYNRDMGYNIDSVYEDYYDVGLVISVRCVQDE